MFESFAQLFPAQWQAGVLLLLAPLRLLAAWQPTIITALIGSHPAGRRRDIGEWNGEHQNPQHGAIAIQPAELQKRHTEGHDGDKYRAQANHHVIAKVEQRNVVRPSVAREFI